MLDEEKSCWMKFWWWANFPSNIFRLIHQSFHVGSVYTFFHPTFPSYDVISNITTSNCQWFNKTKTLCKIVTIKKSHTSNWNEREQLHTHQNISLNADLSSTVSYFIMFWKEPNWCLCIIQSRVLPQRGFSSRHCHLSPQPSFIISSVVIFDLTSNERMNRLACWMTRTNDINFHPALLQHFI